MITRPTQRAARNLVIIAATVLLIDIYNLNLTDLSILGVKAPAELFTTVGYVMLCFLSVNHIVNWLGDRLSYLNWFQSNAVPITTFDDIGGTESPIQSIIRSIDRLATNTSGDDAKMLALSNFTDDLMRIEELLENSVSNFNSLHLYSKFYIFEWYFAVPLSTSIIAFIFLVIE